MYMLDGAPFRRDQTGYVYDRSGERVRLLGNTLDIFTTLASDPAWEDTEVAYVSRTEYPEWAVPCLKLFQIPTNRGNGSTTTLFEMSLHNEIYPGSKLTHFKAIHKRSGIPYSEMLFFDNERWNCTEVSRLGVVCVYTPHGMTPQMWQEGLAKFAAAKQGAAPVTTSKKR
jgi:magnesium-dependent phosphatase 1